LENGPLLFVHQASVFFGPIPSIAALASVGKARSSISTVEAGAYNALKKAVRPGSPLCYHRVGFISRPNFRSRFSI